MFNWLTVLCIDIPQMFFFLACSALIVGRKDVLNFSKNIVRVYLTIILTIAFTYLVYPVISELWVKVIIQIVFFIAVYTSILKLKWYEASVSIIIYTIAAFFFEFLSAIIISLATGIKINSVNVLSNTAILFMIPARIFELTTFIYLFRRKAPLINMNNISLKLDKISLKKVTLLHSTIFPLIQTLKVGKDFLYSTNKNIGDLALQIVITVGWILTIIVLTRRQIELINKEKTHHLHSKKILREMLKDSKSIEELTRYLDND